MDIFRLKTLQKADVFIELVHKHMEALGSLMLMTTDHCDVIKTYFRGVLL